MKKVEGLVFLGRGFGIPGFWVPVFGDLFFAVPVFEVLVFEILGPCFRLCSADIVR